MFAPVTADFDERVREVDLYFQLLSALDNDEIVVGNGTGPQVVPEGEVPADWDSMLKGAAYLVLYNLVEAFIRRGFQAVFDAIKADGVVGVDLSEVLRAQWIMQKNRRVKQYDGAPKHYMEIAVRIVSEIVDKKAAQLHRDYLPVSGNLDANEIRRLCIRHGVDHSTSGPAHGGAALETVMIKRNSLGHGDESFSECGRVVTAKELLDVKDEVVQFMRDILANLEKFATAKHYKTTAAATYHV